MLKAIFGVEGQAWADNYLLTEPLIIDLVWDTRPAGQQESKHPVFVKSKPLNLIEYFKTLLVGGQGRYDDPDDEIKLIGQYLAIYIISSLSIMQGSKSLLLGIIINFR